VVLDLRHAAHDKFMQLSDRHPDQRAIWIAVTLAQSELSPAANESDPKINLSWQRSSVLSRRTHGNPPTTRSAPADCGGLR
jgi:hypothetical protein